MANPHVYIELDGVDQYGENKDVKSWVIECANPGILDRIGWKFNMIHKPATRSRRSSRRCVAASPARC